MKESNNSGILDKTVFFMRIIPEPALITVGKFYKYGVENVRST